MFRMSKRSKHQRKLAKKAEHIKKEIASHPEAEKWSIDAFPYRKKVKIIVERVTSLGYPQRKETIIGLKENISLDKFLGKFQNQ